MLTPHAGLLPRTEAEVERACDDYAAKAGWTVENYSQKRASKVHPGIPDRRYVHLPSGWRVWAELKKPGGKMTLDQHTWIMAEQRAGGLALPVDDVQVLIALHQRWKGLYGAKAALEYAIEVTALTAKRGYRKS